jgi:hypothetical protein
VVVLLPSRLAMASRISVLSYVQFAPSPSSTSTTVYTAGVAVSGGRRQSPDVLGYSCCAPPLDEDTTAPARSLRVPRPGRAASASLAVRDGQLLLAMSPSLIMVGGCASVHCRRCRTSGQVSL